ncbi:HlyD family secretion protein [Sandaracinus amylolyticus]|nr:efflux RND transporter periplasmic adaptor subunit [Sandaracinus amylolyticus]
MKAKLREKKARRWALAVLAVVLVGGFFAVRYWRSRADALPEGIASGNGRIESREVDVATRLPLRVRTVLVEEGELVRRGQVLALMDTVTLEQELAEARESLAAAHEQQAVASAEIARRNSEIELARIEVERSQNLVAERAGSQRELDVRTTALRVARAGLAEAHANLRVAEQQVQVADANVAVIQSRIDDATLTSPVLGRVLYRLAEPGEVLGAGGAVLTLVNLEDVYMEIFLPANQAAEVQIGAEARVRLDYAPDRVAPGYVSFVSPEAQFTPREVETASEREQLMFRVKIQVPRELVVDYTEQIKTGVRGVGYVRLRDDAVWPEFLQRNLLAPRESDTRPATAK